VPADHSNNTFLPQTLFDFTSMKILSHPFIGNSKSYLTLNCSFVFI